MTDAPPPRAVPLRLRVAVVLLFVTITASGVIGSAFSPYLLVEHPLLLIALSPDVRHLVLVAADVPFLPVLGIGEVRRGVGVIAIYGLGAIYGPALVSWTAARGPRTAGLVQLLERGFDRFGALLLILWPFYLGGLLAGAARYRFSRFLPATLLGQVVYIATSYHLGDRLSAWTEPFVRFLDEHLVVSTAVCVVLVAAHQAWTWARLRRARGGAPDEPVPGP